MEERRFNYDLGTKATADQIRQREEIMKLFQDRPMSDKHLLVNLGLYMRSSILAKILFVDELYRHILDIPGAIIEFGVWWGQNLVLAENLRAIYEPFNQTRQIIGFDTFSGYEGFSDVDGKSDIIKKEGYTTTKDYYGYLSELILLHEKNNVLGNIQKHTIVEGDVIDTVPKFFNKNPEMIVALAYFDLALYEPTKVCLEVIQPRLIPGSVIMLDEFNSSEAPGETVAFREVFGSKGYRIKKSEYLMDRSLVFIE